MTHHPTPTWQRSLLTLVLASLLATPAVALLVIDFEQTYYVHPEMQVWDLCLIQHEGLYNLFYHGIPEATPGAANADHIWRATSPDLINWSEPRIVLSISDLPHETLAIWAPAVVHDDATGLWWMAYTGVDQVYSQRICMAWSLDLATWHKTSMNPVLEPDPTIFHFPGPNGYAECRDPFIYRGDDGFWHMLVSAKLLGMPGGQGVIGHSTSTNLLDWSPLEVFLTNDGPTPAMTLESVQYLVINGVHHVFFHEYATIGLSHLATFDLEEWSFTNRSFIDNGIAPEVVSFDGGENHLLKRIGPYQEPGNPALSWAARTDTLRFREGTAAPEVYRPHPLARHFQTFSGSSCLGNPTFGDNPARRGEQPAAPVGNFYFGSKEYYGGPLSNRGSPGIQIGLPAQGFLDSYPFEIQGHSITMIIGGTFNPMQCFVALVDAETDSVVRRATGPNSETMTQRIWDVSDLQGRPVILRIQDSDPWGYLNVDEIRESMEIITTVRDQDPGSPALLTDLGPRPNPFNPSTVLQFELSEPIPCRVMVHDLRGRLVWDSQVFAGERGVNRVIWGGVDQDGQRVGGGVYVYRIEGAGRIQASAKLTLVP